MESNQLIDYSTVTETPDNKASEEQLNRLYTRYRFAREFCDGKDVLEVACGAGLGLGYIAMKCKKIIGGDIDENNLIFARRQYKNRENIELKIIDAHKLPFEDNKFDVVILFEAIYYLNNPGQFFDEAERVLKDDGVIIVGSANKDWSGFNPSPNSIKYFSSSELAALLKERGFNNIKLFGDCPAVAETVLDKIILVIKKTAVALHLMPKTMKGKELLKRIFVGKLSKIPVEIHEGMAKYTPPVLISHESPNKDYKVLFAVGYK